jgi:hypothetical protein
LIIKKDRLDDRLDRLGASWVFWGGKSGHRRTGCWITSRDLLWIMLRRIHEQVTESAAENKLP